MSASVVAVPLSLRADEVVAGELARRRGPLSTLPDHQRRAVDRLARDVAEGVVRGLLDRAQADVAVERALLDVYGSGLGA